MTQRQLLETAVALLLQTAFVVGASALLARRLRRPAAIDRLWSACFLGLGILPLADLVLPHLRLIPAPLPAPGGEVDSWIGASFGAGLLVVWGLGSAALASRLIRDIVQLVRHCRRSTHASDDFVHNLRARLVAEGERAEDPLVIGGRTVRLLFSRELSSPSCWQLHRPTIVLPEVVRSFDPDEAALIVKHELAHLQFGHPFVLFVQRLVEVFLWVHPAVWFARRQASRAREFRCDERAVSSRPSALAYVRSILRLSDPRGFERLPGAALGFGAECPLIVERAERLASRDWTRAIPGDRSWKSAAPLVCAGLAMLLLWMPVGPAASRRSAWSPWPAWSAAMLRSVGVAARDYEIDGHRLRPEEFRHVRAE